MKHKTVRIFFSSIFLCLIMFTNNCLGKIDSPLKKLDSYMQNSIKNGKAIGCAVAVVENGKVVFIKAYGVLKKGNKTPVNLDTVFQLGSVSKPVSSTLIAILAKENRIDISKGTAIHNVLSHTTGYSRKGWNQKIEAGASRDQLLQQLMGANQKPPGQCFDYHNLAYSLLEEIVTTTTHQPFKKVMEEKVFRPLGMTRTTIGDMEFAIQDNYAWPHQKTKKGTLEPREKYSQRYHRTICSAAGINASIKDMSLFLQLQMGEKPEILAPQDLLPFHTPVVNAPDALKWMRPHFKGDLQSSYGLGWRILDNEGRRIVFHGGWLNGFINFLAFLPDRKIGIVVLNNAESSFSSEVVRAFLQDLPK